MNLAYSSLAAPQLAAAKTSIRRLTSSELWENPGTSSLEVQMSRLWRVVRSFPFVLMALGAGGGLSLYISQSPHNHSIHLMFSP
jgi:hypothetical protein